MPLQSLKIVAAILLWIVIFAFGLIPIKWKGVRSSRRIMAYSNCFSGGLFVAIGLIHILPEAHLYLEAREENASGKEKISPFPLSYIICLLTFSFLLFIDKVWLNNMNAEEEIKEQEMKRKETQKVARKKSDHEYHHLGSIKVHKKVWEAKTKQERAEIMEEQLKRQLSSTMKLALNFQPIRKKSKKYCCDIEHLAEHNKPEHKCSDSDVSAFICESSYDEEIDNESVPMLPDNKKEHMQRLKEEVLLASKKESVKVLEHHHHAPVVGAETSMIQVYIIMTAMGLHGIFSGLALGVSQSHEDLFYLFLAMLFHKWSEAFTVGISFVKAKVPEHKAVGLIFLFSVFTPLGIFIGLMIPSTNATLVGVCFALSAGSFLYIATAEIIVDEFSLPAFRFSKFLFYMLGIALVACMGFMED